MATLKTHATAAGVDAFLAAVTNETRRDDTRVVVDMMSRITGRPPVMWGDSMIGFDRYHYRYDSGHEGEYFITGVAPRKTALTVYIMPGFGTYGALMDRLGKYKTGKSCLYINKLADIDLGVLEDLIGSSVVEMRARYPDKVDDGKKS